MDTGEGQLSELAKTIKGRTARVQELLDEARGNLLEASVLNKQNEHDLDVLSARASLRSLPGARAELGQLAHEARNVRLRTF